MDHDVIRKALHELEMQAAKIADAYGVLQALLPADPASGAAPGAPRRARVGPTQTPRAPVNPREPPKKTPPSDSLSPRRATPTAPGASERQTKDDKLVAEIGRVKGMAATAAATYLGVTISSAWSRLQRLVDEGRLTIGGDKVYRRAVVQDEDRVN